MKTILVSGASGIVGYGILKSLRQSKEKYNLIGTTIYTDSIAPAFCDIFEKAPLTKDPCYIDWLCSLIKKHSIDIIIPGIEVDMYNWNENRELLGATSSVILLNNPDLITLCQDKWLFYEKLRMAKSLLAIDSRIDESFNELKKEFGLPFLLKPRRSFASKGIIKVDSEEIFEANRSNYGTILMAQPIVGDPEEEYTTSAFFDKNHKLCCYMTLQRRLSKDGFTEKARVADIHDIKSAVQELATNFKPVGPTNFQFRRHGGSLKLLEINPRISSATSIRTAFGYNESVMSVDYFFNNKTPVQPSIRSGVAVRYIEEHIFYDRHNF